MVRISDIFKKKSNLSVSPGEAKPEEKQKNLVLPSIQIAKIVTPQESTEQKTEELEIAKAMKDNLDTDRAKNLYSKGIQLVKGLLKNSEGVEPGQIRPIQDLVDEVIDAFVLGDKTLFTLFHNDYALSEYLYYRPLNLMIMSIAVGLKSGYNKSRLNELGQAAFLHDFGMTKVKETIQQPDKETTQDTQIINIVDEYETLTHSRAQRKKIPAFEALRKMISCNKFEPQILKSLINLIGIYPCGSYVELNTDELAKVIVSCDDFPLRPIVNIIVDAAKNKLAQPRMVNLAKQHNLYIKRPLPEEEVLRLIK